MPPLSVCDKQLNNTFSNDLISYKRTQQFWDKVLQVFGQPNEDIKRPYLHTKNKQTQLFCDEVLPAFDITHEDATLTYVCKKNKLTEDTRGSIQNELPDNTRGSTQLTKNTRGSALDCFQTNKSDLLPHNSIKDIQWINNHNRLLSFQKMGISQMIDGIGNYVNSTFQLNFFFLKV